MRGVRDPSQVQVVDRDANVVVPAEQVREAKLHLFLLVETIRCASLFLLGVGEPELLTVVAREIVDVVHETGHLRALGDKVREWDQRRHRLDPVFRFEPIGVRRPVAAPSFSFLLLELHDCLVRPRVVHDVHVGAAVRESAFVGAKRVPRGEFVGVDEIHPELGLPREPIRRVHRGGKRDRWVDEFSPGGCPRRLLRGDRDLRLDVHPPRERVEDLAGLVRRRRGRIVARDERGRCDGFVIAGCAARVVRRGTVSRATADAGCGFALGGARAPALLAARALTVRGALLRRPDRFRSRHLPDAPGLEGGVAEAARGRARAGRVRRAAAAALVPPRARRAPGRLAQGGEVQVAVEPTAAHRGAGEEQRAERGRAERREPSRRFFLGGSAARARREARGAYRRAVGIARRARGGGGGAEQRKRLSLVHRDVCAPAGV